eukprot:NODE_679_length_4801_cov_0.851978.p3 type:complete len:249 gc:universal NODE_679_length_4801_cov_0.851978:3738-4484(+)
MFLVTLGLSVCLFLGSFIVGYLPFFLTMDTTNINIVSAGILLGSGLGVILPEAIEDVKNSHTIGIMLILGFVVMMGVDVMLYKQRGYEVIDITVHDHADHHSNGLTIGLLIHALADGIALGSACASNEIDLELSVFLALVLHKGPTAFSLCSLLRKQGFNKSTTRQHLLIFSSTSPIGTMVSFSILQFFEVKMEQIGYLLLFSAGTFIYVATLHVLPEILPDNRHLDKKTFIFLVIGIIIPNLIEMMH